MFYLTLVPVLNILCFVGAAKVQPMDRIVGGQEVSILDFNYQCSVSEKQSHICGGSIISENVIITAAHCVEDINNESHDLQVRCGSNKHDSDGTVKDVKTFKIHPFYNGNSMEYDLALLILNSRLVFSRKIRNIALGDHLPEDGTLAYASGWGLTKKDSNDLSSVLKATKLSILTTSSCKKTAYGNNIKESMFCAQGKETDACEGDSGGPLVSIDGNELVGVTSFGFDCGSAKYPGVYTLISKCLTFIKNTMKTL